MLGVTQSTSEVVEGLGSIIMKMSYGEQSYKLRRRNLMRVTPRHIFDGILLALLVTLTALFSALYDVLQPFWALRHCAAQGEQAMTLKLWVSIFFEGLFGAVLKPLVGVLDGLTMLLNGVGETVGVFGTNKKHTPSARKRQPGSASWSLAR